jgi:acyl carrier protein
MDSIDIFIGKIEAELEGLEPGSMKPEVNYRDLPGWSSMYSLLLVALCESEYNTSVSGEDLRNCKTVQQLYDLVNSRQ